MPPACIYCHVSGEILKIMLDKCAFACYSILALRRKAPIAEWSSLVARRAHNPKVVWFESRLRNQKQKQPIGLFFVFEYDVARPHGRRVMSPRANDPKGEAVVNDSPGDCQSRRTDRRIFSAEKMQDRVVQIPPPQPRCPYNLDARTKTPETMRFLGVFHAKKQIAN